MKSTKKILLVLFAIVALTLVMSVTAFAATINVNDEASFKAALTNAVDGDTILVTDNFELHKNNGWGTRYSVNKAITVDLNGFTITTYQNQGSISLDHPECALVSNKMVDGEIVRGTIKHTVGVAVLRTTNADRIANINLIADRGEGKDFVLPDTNGSGGISIRGGKINTIENVTISGKNLSYGFETSGLYSSTAVVENLINVEVYARRDGMTIAAPFGTATNCTISGEVAGIKMTTSNAGNAVGINLVNTDVISEGNAVVISDAGNGGTLSFVANNASNLVSDNAVFSVTTSAPSNITCTVTGYTQNADGTMAVSCTHQNVVAGSCDVETQCTNCTKLLGYVHDNAVTEYIAPTCIAKGSATYTCNLCGNVEEETLKMVAHEYGSIVTAPTCTAAGYTTHTCATCGDTYVDGNTEALGHTFNVFVERVEPTAEADGYEVYKCENCDETETTPILYCAHNYVVDEEASYDATCEAAGYIKSVCSECGDVKEETPAAKGHSYHWKTDVYYVDKNGETVWVEDGHGCPTCKKAAVKDVKEDGVTQLNTSNNLGYKIVYVSSSTDFINLTNKKASVDFKVIRFESNDVIAFGSTKYSTIQAPITIDLGGCTITCTGISGKPSGNQGNAPFYLDDAECQLVNGTINKIEGIRQAIWISSSADLIEDITVNITAPTVANASGIYMGSNKHINTIRNLVINGAHNNGIEISGGSSIDLMENVVVNAEGQAIMLKGSIGKMTGCTFNGEITGFFIETFNGNLKFENCEIIGGALAVKISGASAGATIDFGNTTFITSGAVFDVKAGLNLEAVDSAVALVNGKLYSSLDDALDALDASDEEVTTFALMNDLNITETIVINKKVNFSLGGGTYKVPVWNSSNFTTETAPGYTVTATNAGFIVTEGGVLTLSGEGKLVGNENSIVVNDGNVIVVSGTYAGFNPTEYVANTSCQSMSNGDYVVTIGHTYDIVNNNYAVDGICNACGYVRGIAYVRGEYYATVEDAINAAVADDTIFLAADIVIDGDVVWDFTGMTFNFNGLTVTVNGSLSIVGGKFTQDVSEYVNYGYCMTLNDKNLYVVNVHEYVAGTPVDGAVTYTCPGCADSYVINNAAVNGEYYLGTDLVVFNNGVLSAMGEEFTYTYNVTTGMIDTNNAMINFTVREGVIYYKDAQPLHQHTGEGYIAEEQADGSINYVCPFCGNVMYVVNNAAINGTYYADMMTSFVFENGVLTANGETYNYTFNVTTGTLTVEGLAEGMLAYVNGKLVFRGRVELHQHVEGGYIEEVTDPTCTDKGYTTYICQFCGPLFTGDETAALGHSYVEDYRTDTEIFYICTECSDSYSEEHIPTHTHTEVIIPAVPGELRNPGMTSGVMCSECGEIIVAPVQANGDFRFAAMNISLGESVSGVYKISVPNGYTNVYVEFDFLGEKTIVTDYEIEASSGRYVFIFNRTRLQSMADLVTATVYGTTIYRTEDGKEYEIVSANSYSNNSVKAFIVNQLKSSNSSAELKTMLSDLLVLGAKTQTYINYKANELMTADVMDLLTPSTYSSMAASSVKMDVYDADTRNIADWKAANIEFSDAMAAILKLQIDPAELENIEIRITIPGVNTADQVVTYTAKDLVFDEGTSPETTDDRYVLTVPNIKALLYGKAIKGEIYHNGVQISRVVNYSVNNFLYANRDSTQSDAHREWIRAVYLYGESVYAYNESQK